MIERVNAFVYAGLDMAKSIIIFLHNKNGDGIFVHRYDAWIVIFVDGMNTANHPVFDQLFDGKRCQWILRKILKALSSAIAIVKIEIKLS